MTDLTGAKLTKRHWRVPSIAVTIATILVSAAAGFLGGHYGASRQNNQSISNESRQQIISSESQLISEIAKDVGPAVVSIDVMGQRQMTIFGSMRGEQSAGTGFIVSADGVIVTNRHVVASAGSTVSVTLADGTKFDDVTVIGRTNENDSLDVAFLKIKDTKGKKLTVAKMGDSSKMQVGDKVVAIGNALGEFKNTVTSGIISGFGRSVEAGDSNGGGAETLQNLFQTDAAINQGNSGGPLVNVNGEVIGINTAVAGNAQNIGFSIPINDVQGLVKGVLEKGVLQRPYLGVRYVSLNDDYAYRFNLSVKRGAYLAPQQGGSAVVSGSPAEKAGLREKDIIVKIDSVNIDENNNLTSVLGRRSVGDLVNLTISRDGKEQKIQATLEAAPAN